MDFCQASVAIILVNWNGYQLTKTCLRSLSFITYPNYQIIVVNNGCHDDSDVLLPNEFPDAFFITLTENEGFTGGNIAGLAYALKKDFDFVLLLNNDTEVDPSFLSHLVRTAINHPQAGILQPLILFNKKRNTIWSAGGRFFSWIGHSKTYLNGIDYQENDNFPKDLDWATGCCVLISTALVKASGGLKPSYFAYFEDVEWSLRIKKLGYKIQLVKEAIVYHEAGASSSKPNQEGVLSPTVFYLHARNQIFLIRDHVPALFKISALLFQISKYLLWMGYFLFKKRFLKAKAVWRGVKDGFLLNTNSEKPLCP